MFFVESISLFLLLRGNSGSTEYHRLVPPFPYSVELRLSYFNRSSMASKRQLHDGSLCHRRRSFHSSFPIRPTGTFNISVGESGDRLTRASKVLEQCKFFCVFLPAETFVLGSNQCGVKTCDSRSM
ncbi:hypothetical protein F2Q70_00039674 [Brassica cretica]|uniref:Secreted protein n=1 Tax=Brassica cretica TaxID=69181 RepID=A0A8S9K773_BRACR|nr:hypothetical protein F2Q70_00039674 [Brassica cretica]KAF2619599.1 hypothetical protein F2Q68_00040378 [Brassica cretica]